jgi:hypothetical protein
MNPKDIKFAKITRLSVFREVSTKFETRINQINSIRIKNQELIERELSTFKESFADKAHLFNRTLTAENEITEMLELMGHDTFIQLQYPSLIRTTLLTSIFTTLETFSRQLIKLAEEHSSEKIKFNDLSNSGSELEHNRRYFSLVHNIDYQEVNKEWSILIDLKNLRNFISHHSGNILDYEKDKGPKKREALERIIKRRKLEIREHELFITNENNFILESMRACKSYFKHIIKTLEVVTNRPTAQITWEIQEDGSTKEIRKVL